jgi:hypothetical protein
VSPGYLICLAASVVVILGARFVLGFLPLRRLAVCITPAAAVLTAVGIVGLGFHCGAMFFPSTFAAIPGTSWPINEINALGTVSIVWYVIAAAMVLAGLRRQYTGAPVVVAVALVAVGVTMYDGGPLQTHLAAIFGSVVILAGVAAVLVLPPWRRTPAT